MLDVLGESAHVSSVFIFSDYKAPGDVEVLRDTELSEITLELTLERHLGGVQNS